MPEDATTDQAPAPKDDGADRQGEPADLGDAGKKALDAERRRAATAEREAKTLKARLEAFEAEKLTDVERAQKAAADATAKLAEYERTVVLQRVALDKGIPPEAVHRLRTDTADEKELAADADALLELLNAKRSPKPDPSQGARGGEAKTSTADQFAAAIGGQFTT